MAKTAVVGEEYKVKRQKSTPKKVARIFILLWILGVMIPAVYLTFTQATVLKEYALVKGVGTLNEALQTQYTALTNDVVSRVNISQYTSKIKVPEIKMDSVLKTTSKVGKASAALAKLGVQPAEKIEDTTNILQKKVDEVNAALQKSTEQIQKTLESDVQAALKKELSGLADSQVQKQLGISGKAYQHLLKADYGLMTPSARQITSSVYRELSQSKKGILKTTLATMDAYFLWFKWGITILLALVLLIPPVIAWWIAKKLSATFTECPYCGKIFISKKAKLGLLKLFK